MQKDLYCEICKSKNFLISKIKGRNLGLYCQKCNRWAVVTSYFSEMEMDNTVYKVYFNFVDSLSTEEVRFWSKIFGMNYIKFKQAVEDTFEFVYEGSAGEVFNVINKNIDNEKVVFYVEPEFPYLNLG